MNMESPHVDFVIAAYAVAGVALLLLLIVTVLGWRRAERALKEQKKDAA